MRLDQKKKKSFQLPHVMVILIGIMLVVTIMSFFIPSGQFGVHPSSRQRNNLLRMKILPAYHMVLGAMQPVDGHGLP